jgi:hypothetical protein
LGLRAYAVKTGRRPDSDSGTQALAGTTARAPGVITDAGELFVEIRSGGSYAGGWYNAPRVGAQRDAAFAPAAYAAALVDSLGRAAAAP